MVFARLELITFWVSTHNPFNSHTSSFSLLALLLSLLPVAGMLLYIPPLRYFRTLSLVAQAHRWSRCRSLSPPAGKLDVSHQDRPTCWSIARPSVWRDQKHGHHSSHQACESCQMDCFEPVGCSHPAQRTLQARTSVLMDMKRLTTFAPMIWIASKNACPSSQDKHFDNDVFVLPSIIASVKTHSASTITSTSPKSDGFARLSQCVYQPGAAHTHPSRMHLFSHMGNGSVILHPTHVTKTMWTG